MPWSIQRRDGKYCVVKDSDGETEGCHASRTDAIKQQRALYANEPSMTAAAAPIAPPRAWFDRPEADEPTPLTFTAAGEVFGHLALWDTCHTGFQNGAYAECVKAPRSQSGYQFFHLGQFETDNGMVAVGKLTYGTGHAPLSSGLQAASKHYDDTGSVGAFVRAQDGRFGIWLAGAVRSDLSPEGLRDLRANPPSGDWRSFNHSLELVASLAVVVPGFPIPRSQLALSASVNGDAEVSALILPGLVNDDLPEQEPMDADEYREKIRALAAAANPMGRRAYLRRVRSLAARL